MPHPAFRRLAAAAALVVAATSLSACSDDAGEKVDEVTIAYQPGLGYAPLLIAKEKGLVEAAMPDVKVNWQVLDSGAAIRDGVISGDVQIAASGAAPFLVGLDAGVEWKTLMAMDNMNLELMTTKDDVKSLADLEGGKVAMPAPDSIQSVVLRKGAEEQLGDPKALDKTIVSLGHPEGLQALVSGQIDAHLTAPPFQAQEAAEGARPLLDSYDLFGEHSFNSLYATDAFVDGNQEFVDAFTDAIAEATALLNDEPKQAARLLADEAGGDTKPDALLEQITADDVTFTNTPVGFGEIASFMADIDMIGKEPSSDDMFFDNDYNDGAS